MALGANLASLDPVSLVYELKLESNSDRDKFHGQWAVNKRLDGGDHYTTTKKRGQSQLTINLTRNAVNSFLSLMTETPPESNILPVETDSPGMYYIKEEFGAKIGAAMAEWTRLVQSGELDSRDVPQAVGQIVEQFSDEQMLGGEPILPMQFRALNNSINPLDGQPVLPEDGAFRFDDITLADLLQRVVSGIWDRFGWEHKTEQYMRDATVIGHRDIVVEYDDNKDDPIIHPALERDTWIDPNPKVRDIADASYYVYAEVLGLEEGIRKYPGHEKKFRDNAEDPGSATAGDGEQLSDRYTDIDWQRDMVVVYTAWIRDQEMEIKSQDGDGNLVVEKIFGLREIRVAGTALIYDGPSRYDDIPVTRLKLLEITDSSYSVGLPEMLQDPQATVNRLFSNISDHTRFLPHPQAWMLESVVELLSNKDAPFGTSFDPITVPDATAEDIRGDPVKFINPPSLDPSHIAFLNIAMAVFHDVAGQGEVNRGIATSKAESGKAIEALQQAGNRTLTLASKWMDSGLSRLNKLTYKHIVDFMPPEKVRKYTDKYPMNVLKDMLRRAQDAEFNVKVETGGTQREKRIGEQQKALLMRQNGAISLQTFLKKMEVDNPKQEAKRIIDEQTAAASGQAQLEQQTKQLEAENEAQIEKVKGEIQIELEKVKGAIEGKLEQLKANLEVEKEKAIAKIKPSEPKSEKSSS